MARALVLLVLVVGCGDDFSARDFPAKPGQAEAISIAATAVGVQHVPPVEWMEGDQLVPCNGSGACFAVRVGSDDAYVGGWTSPGLIRVVWIDGNEHWAWSALAHELGHALLIERGGTGDGGEDHRLQQGPIWGSDGLVANAQAALTAAGL